MSDILEVRNLSIYYKSNSGMIPAVDDVSFTLKRGETIGIVGESGCGKSTLARALIGLTDRSSAQVMSGNVLFDGRDILKMKPNELNGLRGNRISMIFQNALSALNPVYTVGDQITESLRNHCNQSNDEASKRALELLRLVGIPSPVARFHSFPHQLSGGMRQRVVIAIALACSPDIVIADEPTTALDVTIQAQILDLIRQLRRKLGMGMILISHNMGIVAQMCDRVIVMYGGAFVESAPVGELFGNPMHPYTQGLLRAIPSIDEDRDSLFAIQGSVPRFTVPVTGCRFNSRCPHATALCAKIDPSLSDMYGGHYTRCYLVNEAVVPA